MIINVSDVMNEHRLIAYKIDAKIIMATTNCSVHVVCIRFCRDNSRIRERSLYGVY